MPKNFILICLVVCAISCGDEPAVQVAIEKESQDSIAVVNPTVLEEVGDSLQFLFLGHIYERFSEENAVDPRVVAIDRSSFDGMWFGGDLTPYAIETEDELRRLDKQLFLSDSSTIWARGNHDWKEHSERLGEEVLGRRSWEFSTRNGLGVFCYNSALKPAECSAKETQIEALNQALSQAKGLSSFVFLSHHAIWKDHVDLDELKLRANAANGKWGIDCDPETTFDTAIWSRLVELQNNGTQVLCLSGDAGTKKYKFGHWKSPEGIDMMISGIYNSFFLQRELPVPDSIDVDQGIVFTYLENTGPLTWHFMSIDSLVADSALVNLISQ